MKSAGKKRSSVRRTNLVGTLGKAASDADDGPTEVGIVQAHALGERTPHEAIHIGIVEPFV